MVLIEKAHELASAAKETFIGAEKLAEETLSAAKKIVQG